MSRELFIVEGASESLIADDMATRSGKKLHLANKMGRFNWNNWDRDRRTLCNLIVFTTIGTKDNIDENAKADCKNCLNIHENNNLLPKEK